MQQEIELEINVNIGTQKHLIRVPKNADLSAFLQQFLARNHLNAKFQPAILRMVQDKLGQDHPHPLSPSPPRTPQLSSHHSRGCNDAENEDSGLPQQDGNPGRGRAKKEILAKIKQQIADSSRGGPDSREVYEQWKLRERGKAKPEREREVRQPTETSRVSHPRQTLSPDHFYKKGVEFKQLNQQHCEQNFRKLYPFRLNEKEMGSQEQAKLDDRLFRARKQPNVRGYLAGRAERVGAEGRLDEVKLRVKSYDDEVDKLLYQMIREGELTHARVTGCSRSPFRKTVLQ